MTRSETLRPLPFRISIGRIVEILPSVPERCVRVRVSSVANPSICLTFRGDDVRETLAMRTGETLSLSRDVLLRALG
jgi:hypothetical protein